MTKLETGHFPLIVTGASGRIGRMLQAVWGRQVADLPVIWSARSPGQGIDLAWDIGNGPAPALPSGAIVLHLAGQTRGNPVELAENRRAAAALCKTSRENAVRHVFLMSSVAVYRPQAHPITEDTRPDPVSDYGRAKLDAETAAQAELSALTILRLGNLAGADSLLTSARRGPVVLDPIPAQGAGPERSYIGPRALASALAALIDRAARRQNLPPLLNLAQAPALAMGDLLTAARADWRFGAPRAEAIARVALAVDRLAGLTDLSPASASSIVADLETLSGVWPC